MLEAYKISYRHKNVSILENVDISLKYGQLVIIVGPNGAGKSTLLSLLANEIAKSDEPIFFKKKAFEEWDSQILPHHKAKFSQQYNPDIPLSVYDIVMMGRYPYFQSLPQNSDENAAIKSMEMTDVLALKDRKYNTLSGGEKQRVHLARVLTQLENSIAHKLAFMDEPLNNLDVLHQHRIMHTIKSFTEQGNTAVVVLHDLNLAAQFADTILLMEKGTIVCQGKPETVFNKETISKVYNFPCTICANPVNHNPLIIFGT